MVLKNLQSEQLNTLKKIGDAVQEKREEMGYSIETVAEITRISSTMIRNLEMANYSEFTSLVFIRGFLRNYCKFLEIESEWMIQELNQIYEENDRNLDVKIRYAAESDLPSDRSKQQNFLYVFLVVLSVILLFGGLGYYFYNHHLFDSDPPSERKLISIHSPNKASENVENNEGGQVAAEEPDKEKKITLAIEAAKEGWIRLDLDGKVKKEAWLKPDFSYHWQADKSIRLIMGRGDLGLVMFNGVDQPIDPELHGKLVQMSFETSFADQPAQPSALQETR